MNNSQPTWRLFSGFSVSLIFLVSALPGVADAQQWDFEPVIRVGGEFDDNATLSIRTDSEVELTGLLIDLKAIARYSSSTTTFDVQPRVIARAYDADNGGDEDYDAEDVFLRSTFRYSGVSDEFGYRADYDQQEVRTAERAVSDLDIDNPDDVTDDDSGRVVLTGTRDKIRLAPYWNHNLSTTSTVGIAVNFSDVQYDDVIANALNDYTDTRVNLNYRRAMSGVNTALLTVTGRQFSPDDALSTDIDSYGVMAGFQHDMSTTTRVTALVGLENVDGASSSQDTEFVSVVTLQRNLETIRLFARYRRSVNASGVGRLSIRDSLNVNFRRRLTEKISAGLGIRAYQQRGADDAQMLDDRDYIQLQSNFQWYVTPSFVTEVSYRYTVSDRGVLGERSNSNQLNLWFIYQPRTIPKL